MGKGNLEKSSLVGAGGWSRRVMGVSVSWDRLSFTKCRLLEIDGGDGCTMKWMYFMPMKCTL